MCAGTPCRATHVPANFLRIRSFSGVAAVSRYTPLINLVTPVTLQLPGVSHVKLPLKRCRATGGCSSYTCGCRAALCSYGLEGVKMALCLAIRGAKWTWWLPDPKGSLQARPVLAGMCVCVCASLAWPKDGQAVVGAKCQSTGPTEEEKAGAPELTRR